VPIVVHGTERVKYIGVVNLRLLEHGSFWSNIDIESI
jgi:hypothetical protein